MPIRRALISVSDKAGIVDLAQALHATGIELLSTGGTYRAITDAGIAAIEVADYTGFPEMMDGRVKTLHPKIHGGLLQRRDSDQHQAQAAAHDIGPIDLVVVNLYPFEQTVDRGTASLAEKVEQIDIGGPSMLRSAAKNYAAVTVVTDPTDYPALLAQLAAAGDTTLQFRAACARKVYRLTSRYDALIADELAREAGVAGDEEFLPDQLALPLKKIQDCRYGENPHQQAAFYEMRLPGVATLARAQQRNGKALSYNNLMDADAAWELVKEFSQPAVAVIKHTNPCGCAVHAELAQAFRLAWEGDAQAAFGSIIACNRPLDTATAEALCEPGRFVEAIIAPSFAPDAFEVLTTRPKWRKNVRLLETGGIGGAPAEARYCKNILGGLLIQSVDRSPWQPDQLAVVSQRQPSEAELADLAVAWPIVKHLKSNAICLVKNGSLVGAGAGQMSRVTSSQLACQLAGDRSQGAVLASDAFFPFPDGLAVAAAAGITAVVQPGGSKGDAAVIAEADRHDIAMVFTGQRCFRH